MDTDDALDTVTEIEVLATEKRQLDQYEPATAHVSVTAELGEGDDVEEVRKELGGYVQEKAKEQILNRVEQHIRKEMGDDG